MYGADQDTHADTADVGAGRVLPFAKYEFREDQFCCNGTSDRKQYGLIAFKHAKCKMPREQYDRDKNRRYIPEWNVRKEPGNNIWSGAWWFFGHTDGHSVISISLPMAKSISSCFLPDGQRISILSTFTAVPRPKCNLR